MADLPETPDRDTLASYLGKMLVVRGPGLPIHGEPWHLVQVTEPTETGTLNDAPITSYEALFLAPTRREEGIYIFADEAGEVVGAMLCTTFISPTGATCMKSLFTSVEVDELAEEEDEAGEIGEPA
jgi:hypothetical protein